MHPATAAAFQEQLARLQERFAAMRPELEVVVRDPALDVEGYVVVWNTGISLGGPLARSGKGGTRITPKVTLDEVRMLARTMALKNAAAGLPLGGAKSGLRMNSDDPDSERKYRRFVRLCAPFLHENGGPFGGFGFDIGARPQHALWACDELKSTRSFTGKAVSMGGTDYDREGIAGLGVAVAAQTLLEKRGHSASGMTFAIQGMGAMGAAVLRYFSETGARLVALSDPRYGGTWSFDKPLSAELMHALSTQAGETAQQLLVKEATLMSSASEEVLYTEADVLFPCAVQNVITEGNVDLVQAHNVCEGANGPVTEAAREALHARRVGLVPDFIANCGGVVSAFVELTSNAPDKVSQAKQLTREKIAANVAAMLDIAGRYNVTPQAAGLYIALSRIFG
jgi:glutamate dehydrogenase (NAD(P)+)